MTSIQEAKKMVLENSAVGHEETIPLKEACNRILANDVIASQDIPPFDQSNVDGYAFAYDPEIPQYLLKGMVPAGQVYQHTLKKGEAVRIFTGAAVPEGADTVIMQEHTKVDDNNLILQDTSIHPGKFVRPKGSEINRGETALKQGTKLTPAASGYLAGIGIAEVSVYALPSVSIIITGNELQKPGNILEAGQVYESNGTTLQHALQQEGVVQINIIYVKDDKEILKQAIEIALAKSDFVLLTGGVSVGDYDFVPAVLKELHSTIYFHKVSQRPGKPLLFAKNNQTIIFGLPGNPSSVLTCFYEYVIPSIRIFLGHISPALITTKRKLANDVRKVLGLHYFMKGKAQEEMVTALDGQESYKMGSFAQANCLISLEEDRDFFAKGEVVDVHLLP